MDEDVDVGLGLGDQVEESELAAGDGLFQTVVELDLDVVAAGTVTTCGPVAFGVVAVCRMPVALLLLPPWGLGVGSPSV